MKTNARAAWDAEQIARAVGFTTSRFLGVGRFDTRRFDDLPAAKADAAGDRRALVYAITPEGWTIHIVNGDLIPMENEMTTTKTYSSKSNAIRSARSALKGKHRDPLAEVHFRLEQVGEEWAWHEIDLATGQIATGELIEDGATEASGLPPVTVVPAKESRDAKRLRRIAEADARNVAKTAAKAARAAAPKAPRTPKPAGAPKTGSRKAEMLAAAERGELPEAPDFSADTHKRFRPVLAAVVALVEAGNVKGLKAEKTEPKSSSRQAICRYRDLAITALEARAKLDKAA